MSYVRLGPRSIVRSVLSSGFEIHSLALTPRLKWGTTKVAGLAFDFGGVYRTCVPQFTSRVSSFVIFYGKYLPYRPGVSLPAGSLRKYSFVYPSFH